MPLKRNIFDDLESSSASMLVVSVGNLKLYSKILKLLPNTFKIALCVGLRHEPIKDVSCIPKRRVFATLTRYHTESNVEIDQIEHRIQHNFGIPIPFCLDNKATTVRVAIFLVMNDRSLVPICRSMIRLSSTRDPTTAMRWFPLVKYNGFTGVDTVDNMDDFDIIGEPGKEKLMKRHLVVGSIQILTRRVLQDRIGTPDLHDVLCFSVNCGENNSRNSLAEQYDDSSSEYSFSEKDLSSTEYDEEKENLFNGYYSSKIKGCYLESSIESLDEKIPFPFIRFKDILSKYPTLQKIFHLMPLYNQKINKQILLLQKRNKNAKVVLIGDDFGSKYRSGISLPIKVPSSIENIMKDSLDWNTWFCKTVDIAIMQSVEAYSKSTLFPSTGKYKAGKCNMNKKSNDNYVGNKISTYYFEYFMKSMESNMDVLLINTIFGAAATEFSRDIIDDVIFRGRNQVRKFTPYKNLFVVWDYIIKRSYQELGMDYEIKTNEEKMGDSVIENKVGEEVVDIVNLSDISDNESHNIKIQEQKFCKLENDFDEFSEIASFEEHIAGEVVDEVPSEIDLNSKKKTVPLYNSLKRKVVDSIERGQITPLPDDHPFSSLRLFENDRVFIHMNTIGRGLLGILVLGDSQTSAEDASKVYTREISAHMAINEAILRTKVKRAIKIYNSISRGKIPPRKFIPNPKAVAGIDDCIYSNLDKSFSNYEIALILLKGIDKLVRSSSDIFHPSVKLTTVSPSLITCVDYSGFRIVVRPLPILPFTICDWPLPIQSNERSEISNIEKCLNITNILHPTKLISEVRHLPILLETSIGIFKYYNFHHTYNIFPKDPWVSDVKGERLNWGNSSTDEYYYNYDMSSRSKLLGRNKYCTIRPLFIKQAGAVQDMLKYKDKDDKMRRFHYTPSDLQELWRREIEPSGFCLVCAADVQQRSYGFFNIKKDRMLFEQVPMKTISKFTETKTKFLIKIDDGTHCSLCGKSMRVKDQTNSKNQLELISYIGGKIPYPTLGHYDEGAAIRMNRVNLMTSYMQSSSEYFSEWSFSEGDIFRRDQIFWERRPGIYCLPRSCIKGGGNLLGTGLDTIKYLLSQAKLLLTAFDDNIRLSTNSDFGREEKLKIVKGADVFDEPKRQSTVKIFFDESNIGQEIILLSNSLHTNWIEIVLNQLESIPAFAPYDSVTLENFIHSRGMNCNLLGRMLNFTRSPWLKQLFSIEIVSRTIKNLVPKLIKTLFLPGGITYIKKESGNLGRYCHCHSSSPSLFMLHTVFKIHVTSIKRRIGDESNMMKNKAKDPRTQLFSSQFLNTDVVTDQEKVIHREMMNEEKTNTNDGTSLMTQSPIHWNEIFKSLNENNWDILNVHGIKINEISKLLIDWASQFFIIDDNILSSETNKRTYNCKKKDGGKMKSENSDNRRFSDELIHMNKMSLPYWVLECLFSLNHTSLMMLRRHRFHQITILQVMLINLFNLILGDSPNSQLFWSTCISKLCSWEFSIAENSISKNKIPIGALFQSLKYHTGVKLFLDIKKLKENLLDDSTFPIKYDDFDSILPKTKRKSEQYFSESLPIWCILETPEMIKLPRYNSFSVISTPTISQKLIALSIKLSASYFTNIQFFLDYMTHSEQFQGAERHLVRQDWIVQESWLELLGYFSYLEYDKKCIQILNNVINLFPQDHVASVQMRILQMWSYSRLRNIKIFKNSDINNYNNNFDEITISEKSIPHEISVSTLIFEIIDLHWSVIHPIIIDVYTSTALIHFLRGNWKSCEEILEKAITKSLIISSCFDSNNDIIRHFNKTISAKRNSNWEFENNLLDSNNSLKNRILLSNIKYVINSKGDDKSMIQNILGTQSQDEGQLEYELYQKFLNSNLHYIPRLLDTIENPNPNKIPRTPPKLRIGWLLKQLGRVRLIYALHVYYYNKNDQGIAWRNDGQSVTDSEESQDDNIGKKEISTLALLDDSAESILELSCFSTQWALDIFDYYLGATTLEAASCCYDLAYGLILLDTLIKDQMSGVLLKRSCELLIASFDVNSSLLLSSSFVCIENLVQLALVYEKQNFFQYSLKVWGIVLKQLTIKSRTFDDNDYRILNEFSIVSWCTPNKYFNIPLNFNSKDSDPDINQNQVIIKEYISINTDINQEETQENENIQEDFTSKSTSKSEMMDFGSFSKSNPNLKPSFNSKYLENEFPNTTTSPIDGFTETNDKEIDQAQIIISAKSMNKESSQWNLRNVIRLLFYTKERMVYLFMNVCNGNQYHKRLFRLFLLASYLKRGDKLVNLKDWEPILSLNKDSKYVDQDRLGSSHNEKNASGLLFSVIYEANSWLYETEETNLAVSSFIENHPTKIERNQLFSGDGYSGPVSILYNKRMVSNEAILGSRISDNNNYYSKDSITSTHENNYKNSGKLISELKGAGFGISRNASGKNINGSKHYNRIQERAMRRSNGGNSFNEMDFCMSGMMIIDGSNDSLGRFSSEKDQTYGDMMRSLGDLEKCKYDFGEEEMNRQIQYLNINVDETKSSTNPRHLVSQIKESVEMTMIENFFIDLITEAEDDIKIIWKSIKEQVKFYKTIKKEELDKIRLINSKIQYEQRISRLSRARINEILNNNGSNEIKHMDLDLEKSTFVKNINESSELSNIADESISISFPIYKGTLIATDTESKNLLSKLMVYSSRKATFDDEFEQIGNDSKIIYNSLLKKNTVIYDKNLNENSEGKKIDGMKLNLENAFFTENTESDNIKDYTKSSPLSYRSKALDILISLIYYTTDYRDYFSNWKDSKKT
ncbi:uncharacterized protein cubi_00834 [Cryptosporidium ubiquitum]|uniref:Uncharacterized protein n=1 Tax=Cryptosporidium ubiquitum TaxID=857276 RepID=A0A1J4MF48_9CRYT|nr:uncharacterized protein cubi_00834 [Cryptosporidium ubiquitum]OII72862.1 hypothetical protein cubi_00834 [Cryptosporidium ubiquitum]